MQIQELVKALEAYHRLLLPVYMQLAEAEMCGERAEDTAILFSFMGSGASDTVTVGMFRAASDLARRALGG